MPREKDGYRDQLESIIAAFPQGEMVTLPEVSAYCGMDRRSALKSFPFIKKCGKWRITRTSLARALVSEAPRG